MGKTKKLNKQYTVRLSDREVKIDILLRWSDRKTVSVKLTPDGRLIFRLPYGEAVSEQKVKQIIVKYFPKILAAKEDERFKNFVPLTQEDKKALTERALDEMLPLIKTFECKDLAGLFQYKAVWSHRFAGCFWGLHERIELNPVMLLLPEEMQRYVLAHELAHGMQYLRHFTGKPHGKEFYSYAEEIMPGFSKLRAMYKYYSPVICAYSYIND